MKRVLFVAVLALASGCATTVETTGEATSAARASKDMVTGSRLPRSESYENYQGARSMSRQEYEESARPQPLRGN
jgi:hypothetical protein